MLGLLSGLKQLALSRGQSRPRLGVALAAACLWLMPAKISAATFTAALDRDTITLGESATLSLTFSGTSQQNVPTLPPISNLQFGYVGPSSQITIINGQTSSTVTHNFTVTPRQAGDFTMPAFTVDMDGQKLTSEPLQLKVLKPGAPPPEAIRSGSQLAFLKLAMPKKEVYLGEIITADLQLYVREGVQNVSNFKITSLPTEGFNVGKMVERQRRQERVGNTLYTVIPAAIALKPVKTGLLSLGPVTADVVLVVPSTNRRRDLFDPFGMFGGNEQQRLALATDAENLQSLPLPNENVPPNFSGAVGNYAVAVTAGPTNVTVGDPITVRVQLTGRGALDTLALPEQPAWRDFKTYPPTTKVDTSDPLEVQGTKTFEQVVVPQSAEIKELPPVSFTFFDPAQKSYRTLTCPAVRLIVKPGGAVAAPTVLNANSMAQDNPPPTQDIVHIKPRFGSVAQVGPPLLRQPWFLALQGVPLLVWAAALVGRRRAESLANNPRRQRQRQVAQLIRDGLIELRRLASEKKSDAFFATLFRLLQEQLGERLDLPASAITEAVIEDHLRPRGLPDTTLAALQELFQTCNLTRYAPFKTSQEMAAIIPRLETALRDLQRLKL